MEINRDNVFEIINKAGLKPDKDYGQNYLLDVSICEKIVSYLQVENNEKILEIGPGLGSLTHFISLYHNPTTLVDIDQRMVDFLKVVYQSPSINVVREDIRKFDVSDYEKIIGNLPYNITTETVIYLLENAKKAKKMVLMCQAEAFNRFNDLAGKDYGPASILVHLLGSIKKECLVKPGSFYPAPKCASIVFTVSLNQTIDRDYCLNVYKMAKNLFLNRRKTIYNNLSSFLGDKNTAETILNELSISLNKRPEELSPQVFVNIYEKWKSYN